MRAAIQMGLGLDPNVRHGHPDGLLRAKECATKGLCIFCEERLKHDLGRKPLICRGKACKTAYFVAYNRDVRFFDKYKFTKTFRQISRHIEKLIALAKTAPQAPR